ncbi:MAG: type II toxin-antitoxin system VapC family toxin [Candidatus Nitrosocaldus sp.]|nr:type II toxin-antitoxin system VapC family toxin [Candidatus Nitrosocaldus sp.]MDW8000948.1 type II toxin-antitoxin system VapC family toxin [Candidatus Nitrosocaldus sp.]
MGERGPLKVERPKTRVVLDASVVAKWVIPGEPYAVEAIMLKDRLVNNAIDVYAPHLLLYEIASILSRCVKRGVLGSDDAYAALDAIGKMGISIHIIGWEDIADVLRIAMLTNLSPYDSSYIYTAKRYGAVLITADECIKESVDSYNIKANGAGLLADVISLKDAESSDVMG